MKDKNWYRLRTGSMTTLALSLLGLAQIGTVNAEALKQYRASQEAKEYHTVFSKNREVPPEEAQGNPTLPLSPGASPQPDPPETRYPLFESDARYSGEIDTIRWATSDLNLTDTQLRILLAIRMAENGGPGIEFGVLPDSVGATTTYRDDPGIDRRGTPETEEIDYASGPGGASRATLAQQARWAAITAFERHQVTGRRDIPGLGGSYSPPGENPDWEGNVTSLFDEMFTVD